MALTSFPRSPLFRFIRKRSGPFDGEVTLDSSRVYILPTRTGLMFGLLLLLLLVGSINYEKSLGYALTFLMVGIGNIGILTTWKNLKGMVISSAGATPVFAGEDSQFKLRCSNPDSAPRYSISLHHGGREHSVTDIPANAESVLEFSLTTEQRGRTAAGPCKISTEFPFGLFVAWTWVDLDMHCLVYPQPADKLPDIINRGDDDGEDEFTGEGQEVFEGLRDYKQGDSYKRVSWKAFARNEELMIKQYSGGSQVQLWIDWQDIPLEDTEQRLRVLCHLVLQADERNASYGLRLPGGSIDPASGIAHRHRCLQALALYGNEDDR